MIGFASKKGRLFVEAFLSITLKHKRRSKLTARHDAEFFFHDYEFSCTSTPQSSQSSLCRTKKRHKFLPCLSGKALDVESESVVILPRKTIRHSTCYDRSGAGLAKKYSSQSCDERSGTLLLIAGPTDPDGSTEETCREMISHTTNSCCNGADSILLMDGLWSPIGLKDENYEEPDIDRLAEEFIQGFYKKLREQRFE